MGLARTTRVRTEAHCDMRQRNPVHSETMNLMLFATTAFTALLGAQDPAAAAPARAPDLEVEIAGPARWQSLVRPTNLGTLLGSEEGAKVLAPVVTALESQWALFGAKGPTEVRQRMLGYGGSLRLLAWFRMDDPTEGHAECVLLGEPDGITDLDLLGADLAALTEHAEDGWMVGDPARIGGRVCIPICKTGDLEHCLALVRAHEDGKGIAGTAAGSPVLARLRWNVATTYDGWREELPDEEPPRSLGLASIDFLELTLAPAGPHLRGEFTLQFRSADRGIFGAMFPEQPGLPKLIRAITPSATPWNATRFDFAGFHRAVMGSVAEAMDQSVEQFEAQAEQVLGTNPGALFGALDGELLVLGDAFGLAVEDEEAVSALVLGLRDRKAFVAALDELLRLGKGTVNVLSRREVAGVLCLRIGSGIGIAAQVRVGPDHALFVFNDRSGDHADTMQEALAATGGKAGLPPTVEHVLDQAPPGHHGIGMLSVTALLRRQLGLLEDLFNEGPVGTILEAEFGVPTELDTETARSVLPLLEKHGMRDIVSLSGCANGRYVLRIIW